MGGRYRLEKGSAGMFFPFRFWSSIASSIGVNDNIVETTTGTHVNKRKEGLHTISKSGAVVFMWGIAWRTQLHQTPWLAEIKVLAEEGFQDRLPVLNREIPSVTGRVVRVVIASNVLKDVTIDIVRR